MLRALLVATLLLIEPRAGDVQANSVLQIKIVLLDVDRKPTPVPHHALLISDNPATAPPRRIVTTQDGTAEVRLPPGNYTVESDRPVVLDGKAYQWRQVVDIAAGRDTVLELTTNNAEVEAAGPDRDTSSAPLVDEASSLMTEWQNSVVAVWSPTTHASGFLIDANGTIATNQRAVGTATSVEVQITRTVKIAATVLAADPDRDVAILWADPTVTASMRPLPLECAQTAKPPLANGQEILTIGVPLREQKGMTSGTVSRVDSHGIVPDLILETGSAGGPVFTTGGRIVGITSIVEDKDNKEERMQGDPRLVPLSDVCEAVQSAEKKKKDAAPPSATHLPVEPGRPFPTDSLEEAVKRRAGSLNPYQISSTDFDIAFITPVMTYAAEHQPDQVSGRDRNSGARPPDPQQAFVRPLMDFSNWTDYVADFSQTLLVRITPKLVEGFWTKVARGAAQTQGVAIPSIKHFRSGFSKMRAFCGEAEVLPIHPFKLEHRISENDEISEGLYVFDPGALGPQCGTVKFMLFSEKQPDKAETQMVDPKVIEQIWKDFEPYRAMK
jgi:hypothetical protein